MRAERWNDKRILHIGKMLLCIIVLLQILIPVSSAYAEDPVQWALKQQGSKAWSGNCLAFVYDAFQQAGYPRAYYGSATEAAHRWVIPGTKDNYNAPRGTVYLYDSGPKGWGHINISIGGGKAIDGSYDPLDGRGARVLINNNPKPNPEYSSNRCIGYGYYNEYGNTRAFRNGNLEEIATVYANNITNKTAQIGYIFKYGVRYKGFKTKLYIKCATDTTWRYVKTEEHTRSEVNEAFYPLGRRTSGTQWTNNEDLLPGTEYKYKFVAVLGTNARPYEWASKEYSFRTTGTAPGTISQTATKTWLGGPAQRPEIWFQLWRKVAGGGAHPVPQHIDADEVLKKVPANGKVTWTGLPQKDAVGQDYTYSVKEGTIVGEVFTLGPPENYSGHENGMEVKNTYVPPKANVTAHKTWQGGPSTHPTVWFKLYRQIAGGVLQEVISADLPTEESPVKMLPHGVTEVTWSNIPKTDLYGNEFIYLVKEGKLENNIFIEGAPEGYEKVENGLYIANTHIETVDVPVTKKWVGPEAGPVTVTLLADNVEVAGKTVTLKAPDWTGSFTGLKKYASDGHQIVYGVKENAVPNYTPGITGNASSGFIITNTYTNTETVDVPVTKKWVGPEAGPVTVALLADNVEVAGKTVTLKAPDWTGSFTGLKKYASDGHQIVYGVKEKAVPNYTPGITGNASSGFIITNTNTETVDVPITKKWVGPEAGPVTVALLADNVEVAGKTVTLKAPDWTGSFTGLKKYASDGHQIVYGVKENAVPNYTPGITGNASSGFIITNTYTNTETVNVPVTKKWVGPEAGPVTVALLADNVEVAGKTVTLKAPDWTGSFTGLKKYASDGHQIVYGVKENAVPNYTPGITGNASSGFIITNTNTETVDVPITKKWVGPEAGPVTVTLLADAKVYQEVDMDGSLGWGHVFTDLPRYAADGHQIIYTVKENVIPNYASSITGDAKNGFVITNTSTEKTFVLVIKKWNGPKAASTTVKLLADGITKEAVELREQNGWQHTFEDLPKYAPDGEKVQYSIVETPLVNYDTEISGSMLEGFTVINTYAAPPSPPVISYEDISVSLSAMKKLIGGELKAGEFAFELRDGAGKTIEIAKNDVDGSIGFSARHFSREGTFVYTMREKQGEKTRINYDNTVYRIIIRTSASAGKLIAKVSYEKDGMPYDGNIIFVNKVMNPQTGDHALYLPSLLVVISMMLFGCACYIRKRGIYSVR